MQYFVRIVRLILLSVLFAGLSGCEDPQVYGSIGVSSGYSSYYGGGYGSYYNSGPRMRGSMTVSGRIY
jgi:hypothetical protein